MNFLVDLIRYAKRARVEIATRMASLTVLRLTSPSRPSTVRPTGWAEPELPHDHVGMTLEPQRAGTERARAEEQDFPSGVRKDSGAVLQRRVSCRIGILNVDEFAFHTEFFRPATSIAEPLVSGASSGGSPLR
jgi:hypothetical protein